MIAVSYNVNSNGGYCLVVSRDSKILDIVISKLDAYEDQYKRVLNISKSVKYYITKYIDNDNEDILISYAPILKKNKQSDIIKNLLPNKDIMFNNKPLKICNSINRMIYQDRLDKVSFNSDKNPIKVYTDASIIDNGVSTIAYCLIDNKNQILILEARETKGFKKISNCELTAGIAGISKARQYGYNNIIWISDNKDAQNILESNNNFGTRIQRETIRNHRDSFNNFSYKDIKGKNNDLADSLADDIRKKRFPRYLIYKSPCIENKN